MEKKYDIIGKTLDMKLEPGDFQNVKIFLQCVVNRFIWQFRSCSLTLNFFLASCSFFSRSFCSFFSASSRFFSSFSSFFSCFCSAASLLWARKKESNYLSVKDVTDKQMHLQDVAYYCRRQRTGRLTDDESYSYYLTNRLKEWQNTIVYTSLKCIFSIFILIFS